ncbi:hypothetical protein BRARA_A02026 [Brassica rapa]|uniref:Uncharacterized protein n=1 Tax=Brassica campestris TaxID=3711 RepID=A0A398AVF3_BRACM|nr:hypothetical protein BRARA_A02026 [Brassica rapa]
MADTKKQMDCKTSFNPFDDDETEYFRIPHMLLINLYIYTYISRPSCLLFLSYKCALLEHRKRHTLHIECLRRPI